MSASSTSRRIRRAVPAGHLVLSASFEKSGTAMPTEGMLSLYINQEKVGEAKIRT